MAALGLALVAFPGQAAAAPNTQCKVLPLWEAGTCAYQATGQFVDSLGEVVDGAAAYGVYLVETTRCEILGGPFCDLNFLGALCEGFEVCL